MLQNLLADRFKLAFHRETKELSSLVLVVGKGGPKLRASQEDAPGVLGPDKAAMVAQHATMAEFVGALSGPSRTPVIDKTGLTGRYDFTVDLGPYLADAKSLEPPDMTKHHDLCPPRSARANSRVQERNRRDSGDRPHRQDPRRELTFQQYCSCRLS